MKKFFLTLSILLNLTIFAQEYDNLGQKLRIHNAIMGKSIIKGQTGMGITQITYQPIDNKLIDFTRLYTNFAFDINPEEHFHIRTQIFVDFFKNENTPPWLSNMYYQIGWYNWHNQSLSFGYENYGPNQFNKKTDWFANFKRGFVFASYNIDLLSDYANMKFDETSQIRITPTLRYSYEYPEARSNLKGGNHKFILGSSIRWSIARKFYIEGAAYYYPKKETQLPWDPDFTYGFGYFNWHAFKMNISYGNWIANRFPWNKKEMEHHFTNGEFQVMFVWAL